MYRSEVNRDVPPAAPGEFATLRIGPLEVDPPVVLAPMAGVTNSPFRRICRRYGAGLYVSEMITARGFVEGHRKTHQLATFAEDEVPRSIQLYGTDPAALGEATRILVGESGVDHLDMNLGCPVRKVTGNGGGAAIPAKPKLMARLVGAIVENAGDVPVTVKFRMGIDDSLLTFRSAGKVAEDVGCAAVGLHARTAAQLYDGEADWSAIGELKEAVTSIPVLGNGDIYEPHDALRMMRETGCDGVIIGRGCLGRPWLFRDLAAVCRGEEPPDPPNLGEIADLAIEHGRELCEFFGDYLGIRHMRRFGNWYTKGFHATGAFRKALNRTETREEMEELLRALPRDVPYPPGAVRARRAKSAGTQKVHLPKGFLNDDDVLPAAAAEDEIAGMPDGG
ncbi:MAG: tRNA dihydrouridine synthase DusB [Planctomycetota bacterium JB042]